MCLHLTCDLLSFDLDSLKHKHALSASTANRRLEGQDLWGWMSTYTHIDTHKHTHTRTHRHTHIHTQTLVLTDNLTRHLRKVFV